MRFSCRIAIALSVMSFAHTSSLCAQGSLREQTQALTSGTPRRIIAINPFLPLLGSFQGEFEQMLHDNLSVAVSGSYIAPDEDDEHFTSADVKLRLYPAERALQGFGIAAGLGIGSQSVVRYNDCFGLGTCTNSRFSRTGPAFSVEMQYQWLLGKRSNTAVSVGGGAKRYFISNTQTDVFNEFMPTLRLTIGYAFR